METDRQKARTLNPTQITGITMSQNCDWQFSDEYIGEFQIDFVDHEGDEDSIWLNGYVDGREGPHVTFVELAGEHEYTHGRYEFTEPTYEEHFGRPYGRPVGWV